jgi:hypothetical protein
VSDTVGPPDANFVFVQALPSAEWVVAHNLNKFPSVEVVDSNGDEVEGDTHYLNTSTVVLTFVGAFSGKAFFN